MNDDLVYMMYVLLNDQLTQSHDHDLERHTYCLDVEHLMYLYDDHGYLKFYYYHA